MCRLVRMSVRVEVLAARGRGLRKFGSRLGLAAMAASSEIEVLAQELSNLAAKVLELEKRTMEVEAVIERLEAAASTTARALEEVSAHWDAVYRAMRRAE
jgi:outer membrane murein-binding lipoprotein Lpp